MKVFTTGFTCIVPFYLKEIKTSFNMGNLLNRPYSPEYQFQNTVLYNCTEEDGRMVVKENGSHDPDRLESDIDYAEIYNEVSHLLSTEDEDTELNGFVFVEKEALMSSTEQPLILCRKAHHNLLSGERKVYGYSISA